jgi:hypothetical protein
MSLIYDEYGRPFISACAPCRTSRRPPLPIHSRPSLTCAARRYPTVIRDQESKTRLKGIDAQKANILAARTVTNILRTSLGPKGACFSGPRPRTTPLP